MSDNTDEPDLDDEAPPDEPQTLIGPVETTLQALIRRCHDEHWDRAPWAVLADYLTEEGAPDWLTGIITGWVFPVLDKDEKGTMVLAPPNIDQTGYSLAAGWAPTPAYYLLWFLDHARTQPDGWLWNTAAPKDPPHDRAMRITERMRRNVQ